MKKTLISITIALASGGFAAAHADDGQVDFTGEIVDQTCEVTNNISSPLQVTLGKVSRTVFSGKGSTATPTKFTIELINCPTTINTATVTFHGDADSEDSSSLELTQESGVADHVAIQLSDKSGSPLPLDTASTAYTLTSGGGTNELDFTARYIATSDSDEVTAGPANSTATFTINYN